MNNFPKEDLLHYVWRTKRFDFSALCSSEGDRLEILSFGIYNENAGPDFLEARLLVNDQLWAGQVEMHVKSSDWYKHGHETDPRYDNVILHVVYVHDKEVSRSDGSIIPCVELQELISSDVLSKYNLFQSQDKWVPCQNFISQIDSFVLLQAKQKALIEKLESRSVLLHQRLNELNGDWIQLVYEQLFRSFGLKINSEAFLSLAKSIPFQVFEKKKDQLLQIEALLFGVAGLLPASSEEAYVRELIKEFEFLKYKYRLTALNPIIWKFARLRPAGFPTIRIAQLARLIHQIDRPDELFFKAEIGEIKDALAVQIKEGYWFNHYLFNKLSDQKIKTIGEDKLDVILINSVVPLLFLYGEIHRSQPEKDKALNVLESLRPEKNAIVDKWKSLGLAAANAADSQGLLELKRSLCSNFKCLSCPIGHHIISK